MHGPGFDSECWDPRNRNIQDVQLYKNHDYAMSGGHSFEQEKEYASIALDCLQDMVTRSSAYLGKQHLTKHDTVLRCRTVVPSGLGISKHGQATC